MSIQLPDDVLLLIAEQIQDPRFLLKLHLCRHWRSVFFRKSYQFVRVSGAEIVRLLRAIHLNPAIGSAIKRLYIADWYSGPDTELPQSFYQDGWVEELFARVNLQTHERQEWLTSMESEDPDAWCALLLASLESLTSLTLAFTRGAKATLVLKTVLRAGLHKDPSFTGLQRLEEIRLECESYKEVIHSEEVIPFLHLPSLRSLSADSVVNSKGWSFLADEREFPLPAKGLSSVETLELSASNGRYGMTNLICSCANLKRFTYQHTEQEIWGETYVEFRPKAFYRALRNQTHSLEVLHLNDCGQDEGSFFDEEDEGLEDPDGWFGSLIEFTRLSELRMRAANLLDLVADGTRQRVSWDTMLPASLEYLRLTDCSEIHLPHLVTGVEKILAEKQDRFPRLKTIAIWPGSELITIRPRNVKPVVLMTLTPVKEACELAGVGFEINDPWKGYTGPDHGDLITWPSSSSNS